MKVKNSDKYFLSNVNSTIGIRKINFWSFEERILKVKLWSHHWKMLKITRFSKMKISQTKDFKEIEKYLKQNDYYKRPCGFTKIGIFKI